MSKSKCLLNCWCAVSHCAKEPFIYSHMLVVPCWGVSKINKGNMSFSSFTQPESCLSLGSCEGSLWTPATALCLNLFAGALDSASRQQPMSIYQPLLEDGQPSRTMIIPRSIRAVRKKQLVQFGTLTFKLYFSLPCVCLLCLCFALWKCCVQFFWCLLCI